MQHEIKKYPVQHQLLKNYIKFYWELRIDHVNLNHKIIPQRNINLRFNLSETPQFICIDGREYILEDVFFSGLQDHFLNAHMKLTGNVHVLGVCFQPDGFYPFLNIPVSEFKNRMLGAGEIGFKPAKTIADRLKAAGGITSRINILENELALLLYKRVYTPETFRQIFNALKKSSGSIPLSEFCKRNNLSMRSLERMFNKYVGVSAKTFVTLNRFQNSLNQLLYDEHGKLSDIAYVNGYFDQMHFIKDFKRFAGNTPKGFVNTKDSILQIGTFTSSNR